MRVLSLLLVFCASCATSGLPRPEQHRDRYLIVHTGSPADFHDAQCVELEVNDSGVGSAKAVIARTLIPNGLSVACPDETSPRLIISYTAGPGACIDCSKPSRQQSGFAFITLLRGSEEVARAEWQYWRGGTPKEMAQEFSHDLDELWQGGITHGQGLEAARD
jgi:hypothetical protein